MCELPICLFYCSLFWFVFSTLHWGLWNLLWEKSIEWSWRSSWWFFYIFPFPTGYDSPKTFGLLHLNFLIQQWISFWFVHLVWSLLRNMGHGLNLCVQCLFCTKQTCWKNGIHFFLLTGSAICHDQRVQQGVEHLVKPCFIFIIWILP